jgi:hypothetical protein
VPTAALIFALVGGHRLLTVSRQPVLLANLLAALPVADRTMGLQIGAIPRRGQ